MPVGPLLRSARRRTARRGQAIPRGHRPRLRHRFGARARRLGRSLNAETRAVIDKAKADCARATARHRDTARAAMLASIADRWKAAAELPRIPGHDPLVELGVIAS